MNVNGLFTYKYGFLKLLPELLLAILMRVLSQAGSPEKVGWPQYTYTTRLGLHINCRPMIMDYYIILLDNMIEFIKNHLILLTFIAAINRLC